MAELLGAGVAKALLGKAALPDDLPFVTGSIGLLGTKPSWDMMIRLRHAADGRLELSLFRVSAQGGPGARRADRHRRAHAEPALSDGSEPRSATAPRRCARCIPLLERKTRSHVAREDREGRSRVVEGDRGARDERRPNPINPQRVFWELSPRLPDNCILAADSGSAANWYARDLKIRRGMMASLSGNLATMGPGVPYAIAAKFAYPGSRGDRAGRRRRDADERHQRADHRSRSTGRSGAIRGSIVLRAQQPRSQQVTWEQRVMAGDPKFEASQELPDFPMRVTPSCSACAASRVDQPEQVGEAWDQALAADRPVVFEAITDPDVPPLPPHITFEQAKNFIEGA